MLIRVNQCEIKKNIIIMERKPNKNENRALQKYTINNIDDIKLTNECKGT